MAKTLSSDIIKLIQAHTDGLSKDRIENQIHHLQLLGDLARIGKSQLLGKKFG